MMMQFLNKFRIQQKMFYITGMVVLISALVTMWNVYNVIRISEETNAMLREINELNDVELAQVQFIRQDLYEKNYLLSGDESYLYMHESNRDLVDIFLSEALLNAATTSDKVTLFDLKREVDAYDEVYTKVVNHYSEGDEAGAIAISLSESEEILENIRQVTGEFVSEGEQMVAEYGHKADRQARFSMIWGAVGVLLMLVVAGTGFYVAVQQLGLPVSYLNQTIQEIGEGQAVSQEFRDMLTRKDEIGYFARAILDMQTSARERREALQARIDEMKAEIAANKA